MLRLFHLYPHPLLTLDPSMPHIPPKNIHYITPSQDATLQLKEPGFLKDVSTP